MSFGNYLENKLLDHVFGNSSYSVPGTVYLGLSSTDPGDDGSGITEPSGGNYARVAVNNNATNFPDAVSGSKSNGTNIAFPTASGLWGTMAYFFWMDDPTAGNYLGGGSLSNPKLIDIGDAPSFAPNDITINLD